MVAICLPGLLWAQRQPQVSRERVGTAEYYNRLLNTNPALKVAVIDSLNRRSGPGDVFHHINGKPLNDSVRQLFSRHVNAVYGAKQLQQVNRGLQLFRDTAGLPAYLAGKLRGFYALRNEANALSLMKAGAYSNHLKVLSGSAFYDNTPGAVLQSGIGVQLEDMVVVGNIPVNIVFNNLAGNSPFDQGWADQQLKKFSFDKDAYMDRLNGYLNKSYDLKKYFLGDIDVASAVKSFATLQVNDIQEEMKAITSPQQALAFSNLVSAEQLIYLDSNQIRRLLLDNKTLQLTEEDLNSKLPDSTGMMSGHQQTVLAAQQYLRRLSEAKNNVVQGLQAKEALAAQHKINGAIQQRVNDPEAQKRNIKELLPLNFIQRLLLQTKRLNIGNIAANGSKGGVQDLFMSGVQGEFLNKQKFLMLGLGTTRLGGDLKDRQFTSSLDPGAYSMQFLQMGQGDINVSHSHIAMMNANTKNKNYGGFDAESLKRNIFVGAFSEQINLGEYGAITADISKSNTTFNNAATGNSAALSSKTAAFTLLDDFWQTFSAGLDYNGEWKAARMSQRVYFNYSGLAYTNPGSPGGSRGTIRYGLNIRRYWNKRKIMVGFRTDLQDMNTAASGSTGWRNRQYTLDTRIRVKKNFSLSARMGQSTIKNTGHLFPEMGYFNRQINVASQLTGKLFSHQQNNNISFGVQQMDILPMKSLLINLNINHSIVIGTHVLSVSVFYNKDVKDQALYGNLFTAETGWSYQLGKIWSCSSGINYLDNKNVVRQIGLRQTFSASLAERLHLNLYADCRKQLLNTPQNYLFGNINTQLALNYQLNR